MERGTTGKVLLRLCAFGIAFSGAYAYAMSISQAGGSPFWLPDSVFLCALLLTPSRTWPAYVAVTLPLRFLISVPADAPVWFLFAAFANDSLKALIAAGLLRWTLKGRPILFDLVHDFWTYLGVTCLVTPILSAFAGATMWVLRGRSFWPTWRSWFFGNVLTHLVCTPLLLSLAYCWREFRTAKPSRVLEAIAIFAAMTLAVRFAYQAERDSLGLVAPIDYAPVAFLLLATVRFGPLGASGSLVIMSVLAIRVGQAAASLHPELTSVLSLQLFLIVIGVPTMVLAVLLQQHRKTEEALRENQERLENLNSEQQRIMDELTKLHQRLISVQEDERRRIGRELHDDLNQQVAALGMHLSRIRRTIGDSASHDELGRVESSLTHLAGAIHALSHELHPAFLERTGIEPALRAYCAEFDSVNGTQIHMQCEEILNLPSDLALCLYRVAQEAVRNAVKHSAAKHVWVSLSQSCGQVHLRVKDSGKGFDPTSIKGNGIGLVSMEDRAKIVGGTVSVSSHAGEGTVMHCVVPWPSHNRTEHVKAKSAHRG